MTFYNNASTLSILFFMTINSCIYAMENPSSDAMSDSTSSSPSNFTELLSYYVPTKEGLWSAYETVSQSAVSVYENALIPAYDKLIIPTYNTVTIGAINDFAFIKLGYPITDLNAQEELRKGLEKYTSYFTIKKQLFEKKTDYNNNSVRQQHDELHAFIMRRNRIIERAANSLSSRLDGIKLAHHCLRYHGFEPVMTAPIKNIISLFIKKQMEAEEKAKLPFVTQLQALSVVYKEQNIEDKKDGKGGNNEGNQSGGVGNS